MMRMEATLERQGYKSECERSKKQQRQTFLTINRHQSKERCLGIAEGGTTTDVLWPTSELLMGMRTTTTGICWKCCSCLHRRLLGSVDLVKGAYFVKAAGRQRRQELRWQEKWQLCRRLLSRMSEREIRRWEGKWHTTVRHILTATVHDRMR
ncbi:hypothetical protein B296_00006317 [Ensete ventricosum]|uniref:Uncharacterized protein n=1 Tax=Ensete ventricosum TaxID=4639 RepID=A0A427A3R7_ENSVE|nr:hypothetical protein B296_00006317 [Ensete ventricosum]